MIGRIRFGKATITYDVVTVPRRTMEIAVHPDKRVVVKVPSGASPDEIQRRVRNRARWILRQIAYFGQFDPRTPPRHYVSGETHLYLGRQYRLKVLKGDVERVSLARGRLVVEVRGPKGPKYVQELLEGWYRTRALQHFQASLERCRRRLVRKNCEPTVIHVRKMRARWGSLSRNGRLTLNLSLIRASRECIDYVITHELCHVKHADHGPEFYKLLEKVMPDWEGRKRKLELSLC